MFTRIFDALRMEYRGVVTAKAYDAGEALKDKNTAAALDALSKKIVL